MAYWMHENLLEQSSLLVCRFFLLASPSKRPFSLMGSLNLHSPCLADVTLLVIVENKVRTWPNFFAPIDAGFSGFHCELKQHLRIFGIHYFPFLL